MGWSILYKGFTISGLNGCDACTVKLHTKEFEWEILCKSVRSGQVQITKHINRERMAEVQAMYKEKQS